MQNKINDILEILYKDAKIAETLNKIFSGYYVTDRERKEAMKSGIDLLAREQKLKVQTQEDLQRIDNQANALKSFIENIKEINY